MFEKDKFLLAPIPHMLMKWNLLHYNAGNGIFFLKKIMK